MEDPSKVRDQMKAELNGFLNRLIHDQRHHIADLPADQTVYLNFHFTLDVSVPFRVQTLDEKKAVESFLMFIKQQRVMERVAATSSTMMMQDEGEFVHDHAAEHGDEDGGVNDDPMKRLEMGEGVEESGEGSNKAHAGGCVVC